MEKKEVKNMTEQFSREYILEETERIREVNRRLSASVRAIGLSAEITIGMAKVFPSINSSAIEIEAGQSIRQLIQDHLNRYLVGPTSVRGRGAMLGAYAYGDISTIGAVLDVDNGQLLHHERMSFRRVSSEPLPDKEWFRHWRGALYAATTIKAY